MKGLFELILDGFLLVVSIILVLMTISFMVASIKENVRDGIYIGVVTIMFLVFWKVMRVDTRIYKLEKEMKEKGD